MKRYGFLFIFALLFGSVALMAGGCKSGAGSVPATEIKSPAPPGGMPTNSGQVPTSAVPE